MLIKQPQAFSLQAVPAKDGLHLVLPPTVSKVLMAGKTPQPQETVPIYGVMCGHSIQISYEKLTISIPAMSSNTADFKHA